MIYSLGYSHNTGLYEDTESVKNIGYLELCRKYPKENLRCGSICLASIKFLAQGEATRLFNCWGCRGGGGGGGCHQLYVLDLLLTMHLSGPGWPLDPCVCFVYLFVNFVYLFVKSLCLCFFVCLPICKFHLPICKFPNVFVFLSVYLFVNFMHLFVNFLQICFVCFFTCLWISFTCL